MNQDQSAIFEQLQQTLVQLFELDPASLTQEARLYEDLDIDSIDTVDLFIELKQKLGKDIPPERFRDARTLNDVATIIASL